MTQTTVSDDQKRNHNVEARAILEAIGHLLNGQPVSEFMLSFPVVQDVADLKMTAIHADVERDLLAALKFIAANDPDCACDHTDENCCASFGIGFCAKCLAAKAIAKAEQP